MHRNGIVTLTLLLALGTATIHGQEPIQLGTLPPEVNKPLDPAYTIKAGTQLVVLDVVVKDRTGAPVHGLKASDFIVKENGHTQSVRDFDEHTALTPAQLAEIPPRPQLPPGEFTNFVTTPQTGALTIILIDELNTAVKDQLYMRQQLIDYLKHSRPDARTAIYAINTHLLLLQGFTSDPAVLLAALTRNGKPTAAVLSDGTSGGVATSANSSGLGAILTSAAGGLPTGVSGFEAPVQAYQAQMRANTTLDALNDLGRNLVTIPGRKNLIWFAGDFPPEFFPSENPTDSPYALTEALDQEYRDTVNLLSRAQVAVYTIDAQGLRTDQSNNASKGNASFASGSRGMSRNGAPADIAHAAEFGLTASESMAAKQIAEDTGGKANYNHNDLTRMVRDAIEDGSNYYTLTYVPSADNTKDGLRTISVKIEGHSYSLSYRRGYFSDHSKRHIAAGTAASDTLVPRTSLQQALLFGSPQPTQVLIRTKAFTVGGPDQATVMEGNEPNPDPKKNHGPYQTVEVDIAASIAAMSFRHGADNIYHTDVDFVTYVYDFDGNLINAQSNTVRTSYTKEKLAAAFRSGLTLNQRVSVPAKGSYFLRVAVHDGTSEHVGAVEIPVAGLAPGAAPPTTP
jgi:VWFA-related protein